jgi:hypothetical protein
MDHAACLTRRVAPLRPADREDAAAECRGVELARCAITETRIDHFFTGRAFHFS